MKILIAVDPSNDAQDALDWMRTFRLPSDAELYLMHVIEQPRMPVMPGVGEVALEPRMRAYREEAHARAQQLLSKAQKPFQRRRVKTHLRVVEGFPATELCRTIDHEGIDLTVLGTRGLSGLSHFLLGSVSEEVLHRAACSVLIARGKPRWAHPRRKRPMRILGALDTSPKARAAVEFLQDLGMPSPAQLTLVHVIETNEALTYRLLTERRSKKTKEARDLIHRQKEAALDHLQEVGGGLRTRHLEITHRVVEGHPASEILRLAERQNVDLVVAGSHGLTGIKRWLVGSVSRRLAHYASRSVLIVRPGRNNT